MCGIIGILGKEPVAGQLVDSLKRLEYRGYDSAGVATLENGVLTRCRAEGKLKNLEAALAKAPLHGTIGIGHTRWATHGAPTETNAHPHASDGVAVVHNGIITNHAARPDSRPAAGCPAFRNAAAAAPPRPLARTDGARTPGDPRPQTTSTHATCADGWSACPWGPGSMTVW